MNKSEALELICTAINDCDNAGMKHTSETLQVALKELEDLIPDTYHCENCGTLMCDEVMDIMGFVHCQKCGAEVDVD